MSSELRVSSRAEADLAAAFAWYEQRSPGLGEEFVRCVDVTITLIVHSPLIFRTRLGEYRLAMTPRFPYAIYFIYDAGTNNISIRRILHFAQNHKNELTPP